MEDVKKMVIKNKMKPTTAITSISLVITLSLLLFAGALISSNDNNLLAKKKDGGHSGGDKGTSSGDGSHHDSGKGGSSDGGDSGKTIAKPKPEGDSGSNVPPAGGNGNVVGGPTTGGGSTTGGAIGGEGSTSTTPTIPTTPVTPLEGQPGQPQCDPTSTECPQPSINQPTPPCDPAKDATCNQPPPICKSVPGTTCSPTPPPGICPDGSTAVDGKCTPQPPPCDPAKDKNCPLPTPCDSAKEKCCPDGSKPDANGNCQNLTPPPVCHDNQVLVNGTCIDRHSGDHHPGRPIIIKNVFRNTIINNILVLLQQVPLTTQNDIELVNCTNALIHHNNSMLPQCDIDIRNDYIGQNYDSNIAYQLAADYLQARRGMSLGTTTTATTTTTTPSESIGSINTSSRAGSTTTKTTTGSTADHNTLQQIPSKPTDFPGNDANAIQIHVTSAKKDIIGDYHVKGEITNIGKSILNFVKVTVHFYDAKGQLIADSSCCYTDPINIDPGHTSTFDSFAMANEISGEPVSYRLSYDWSK